MANNYYLQRNIFSWLEPIFVDVGLDPANNITWENDNAVRPDLTHWVSLSLTNVDNTTTNEVRYQTNAHDLDRVDEIVIKRAVATLTINIYGEDSTTIANYIQQYMSLSENIENALILGIGYISSTDTQDLSQLISGEFKSRAMFKINLNHTDMIGDSTRTEPSPLIPSLPHTTQKDTSVGTIGHVTIKGQDQDGNEIINTTIDE